MARDAAHLSTPRVAFLAGGGTDELARVREILRGAGFAAPARVPGAEPGNVPSAEDGEVVVVVLNDEARERLAAVSEMSTLRGEGRLVALMPDDATPSQFRRALRSGADGIVLDGEAATTLVPTLIAVSSGQIVLPAALRQTIAPHTLTLRERECLSLAIDGLSNAEIASRLFVSQSTVKTHLHAAFAKIGVGSRAEAATLTRDPEMALLLGLSVAP